MIIVLNVLATVATQLCYKSQGNFLIQAAFGCGEDVRVVFFDLLRFVYASVLEKDELT